MPQRLIELFSPGDRVMIDLGEWGWLAGVVTRHAYPGVWVQTGDGRFWFVTNGRKIRRQNDE